MLQHIQELLNTVALQVCIDRAAGLLKDKILNIDHIVLSSGLSKQNDPFDAGKQLLPI